MNPDDRDVMREAELFCEFDIHARIDERIRIEPEQVGLVAFTDWLHQLIAAIDNMDDIPARDTAE